MKSRQYYLAAGIVMLIIAGCNVSVNKSIKIPDGKVVRHSLNSVNGGIDIGSDCRVQGNSRSVNGGIDVGRNSRVKNLETVNGWIEVAANVQVDGDIKSINGGVTCERGVTIRDGIITINGSVELEQTVVEKNVSTYNGHITLQDSSVVHGDLIIKKHKSNSSETRRLKIQIANGSVVEGDVDVRGENVEVKVYLSNGGKVLGRIINAELIGEDSSDVQ